MLGAFITISRTKTGFTTDIGVTPDNHLITKVCNPAGEAIQVTNLGLATRERFNTIKDALEKLSTVAANTEETIARQAGQVLDQAYPFGYRSEDKEP